MALSFGSRTLISPEGMAPITGQTINPEQVRLIVEQALNQNQKSQEARWQQLLTETGKEWNLKRQADYATIAGQLKFLESTQNVVWKETIQNKSFVESLARDLYLRTGQARAGQP